MTYTDTINSCTFTLSLLCVYIIASIICVFKHTMLNYEILAQPMRVVQYDIASGQSFLTPIRGGNAPPVLHTDPVYHVSGTQAEGATPRPISANSGYPSVGGIVHLVPTGDSLHNQQFLSPPHSPGRTTTVGGSDQRGPTLFRSRAGRGQGE